MRKKPRPRPGRTETRQEELAAGVWERDQLLAYSLEEATLLKEAKRRRPRWAGVARAERRAVATVLKVLERKRDQDDDDPLWRSPSARTTTRILERLIKPSRLLGRKERGGAGGGRLRGRPRGTRGTWLHPYVERLGRILHRDGGSIYGLARTIHQLLVRAGHDPTDVTRELVRHVLRRADRVSHSLLPPAPAGTIEQTGKGPALDRARRGDA